MAKGLDLQVHKFAENPSTKKVVLVETKPYVQLKEGDTAVFLQRGSVFYESGPPVPREDWPGWLEGRILDLAPKVIAEIQFEEVVQALNDSGALANSVIARNNRPKRTFGKKAEQQ